MAELVRGVGFGFIRGYRQIGRVFAMKKKLSTRRFVVDSFNLSAARLLPVRRLSPRSLGPRQ